MTKLSDTQLVILTAACQREGRRLLPLPERLKGGAATKVVDSLIAKGLAAETQVGRDDTVWREDGDNRFTLIATDAALEALGIENETPSSAAEPAKPKRRDRAAKAAAKEPKPRRARDDSKQAKLIAMLKRPKGATVAEIADAVDWQHHTVRGAIAGALKKKLGLDVTSEKVEGRGRVYRIDD